MAATLILPKLDSTTASAFTITLASLATSTTGVGRQSTLIDNTSFRYSYLWISAKIKLGTSPTANKGVYVALIVADSTPTTVTDNFGASDAAATVLNAPIIMTLVSSAAPSTGDILAGWTLVDVQGVPKFGVAIYHDTAVNLDSTAGSHTVRYIGVNPEIQ